MKRIFLVRHGETDWNLEGRFQGKMDIPLNILGKKQAEAASGALGTSFIGRVISSHLSRASETAGFTASLFGLPVELERGLAEIDHGLWEGHTAGEVEKMWPGMLDLWHSSPEKAAMPGGESLHDVSDRAWKAFREVLAGPGDVVAVFSHDAVIKVILCRILGCPLSSFWRFSIANGSITLIEDGGKGLSISVMGDSCHLGSPWMRKEQKGL
jgi:probable phosphoglycerate mutase